MPIKNSFYYMKNTSRKIDLISGFFQPKSLVIFTLLVYGIVHTYFYSFSEWLNTDYERQIYSIANSNKWFFIKDGFSSRVPPLLPIVVGLTLKFANNFDVSISLLGKVLNLGCILANAFLLYRISSEFINDRFRFFAPFFYLLNPIIIYYSFKPLSEHLFMVFFLVFILKIVQYFKTENHQYLTLALFGFSLSLLVRPTYLYFFVFLIIFLIYYDRFRVWKLLVPFLVCFLVLLPWATYSYMNSNKVVISSTGSIQSLKDGIAYDNKGYRNTLTSDTGIRKVMDDFWNDYYSFTNTGQVFNYYLDQLKTNPIGLVKFQLLKICRVFIGTDTINKKFELFMLIINSPIIIMLMHWMYSIGTSKTRSSLDVFFIVLLSYTLLISSIVVPLFRYIIPIFYIIPILSYYQFRLKQIQ